ncbi:hypothetical protein FRB97_004793, partial [Tulasnella sp. 331]
MDIKNDDAFWQVWVEYGETHAYLFSGLNIDWNGQRPTLSSTGTPLSHVLNQAITPAPEEVLRAFQERVDRFWDSVNDPGPQFLSASPTSPDAQQQDPRTG